MNREFVSRHSAVRSGPFAWLLIAAGDGERMQQWQRIGGCVAVFATF
jgi:hypothetical protein